MRPHKLTMKSFGPFVNETTVDFDAMGNEIYLISGATGAGKTTIFDAMVYALYGTASGSARGKLGIEALHSDLAKDGKYKEPMQVSFTFSNAGKTYTVERSVYWGKTGKAEKSVSESSLSEDGSTIVTIKKSFSDKDDVSTKVTEILGLDANQFKNIIMLAQGEFQKFLTSGSDKRGEILGKLYDNRQHKDFQLRLKAAYDALLKKAKDFVADGKRELVDFEFSETVSDTMIQGLYFDTPDLLVKLETIIKDIEDQHKLLSDELSEKNKAFEQLKIKKSIGNEQKGLLDSLKQSQEDLTNLENKKEEILKLNGQITSAVSAAQVISFESIRNTASSDLNDTLSSIDTLTSNIADLEKNLDILTGERDQIKEQNSSEIETKTSQKNSLNGVLPLYDDLMEIKKNYTDTLKELKTAKENVEKLATSINDKKADLDKVDDILLELKDAGDAAVDNAKRHMDDLEKQKDALSQLAESITKLANLESIRKKAYLNLNRSNKKYNTASDHHRSLNDAFIAGQAGILADTMREELETKETVICPVCHSQHTKADADTFAIRQEHTPSKGMVDAAWKAVTDAKDSMDLASNNFNKADKNFGTEKTMLLAASKELLQIDEWDKDLLEKVLENTKTECEKEFCEAQKAYEKAKKDKSLKEQKETEKKNLETSIHQSEEALDQAQRNEKTCISNESSIRSKVSEKEALLKGYPARKEDALKKIRELEGAISKLNSDVETANNKVSECEQNLANMRGSHSEKLKLQNQQSERLRDAIVAFATALSDNNFSDETLYHQALSPEGVLMNQTQIHRWIELKQKEVNNYHDRQKELNNTIHFIQESLKDKEIINLEEVDKEIDTLSPVIKTLSERQPALWQIVLNDRKRLKNLITIKAEYNKTERAINKIKPLYDVANGKYKFYNYVLSDFFKQIIDQANIHLNIMTDGEYSLVHKITGDNRTSLGLDLNIYNNLTDVERNTATLSGGQLFEASLALALGLSDVAQMQSTSKIQVDSMFIDEGFGSLDKTRLTKALSVLNGLSAGKRQIGIISHVAQLEEQINKKIHVYRTEKGSYIKIESDT